MDRVTDGLLDHGKPMGSDGAAHFPRPACASDGLAAIIGA
jgi:hypothetical protein